MLRTRAQLREQWSSHKEQAKCQGKQSWHGQSTQQACERAGNRVLQAPPKLGSAGLTTRAAGCTGCNLLALLMSQEGDSPRVSRSIAEGGLYVVCAQPVILARAKMTPAMQPNRMLPRLARLVGVRNRAMPAMESGILFREPTRL